MHTCQSCKEQQQKPNDKEGKKQPRYINFGPLLIHRSSLEQCSRVGLVDFGLKLCYRVLRIFNDKCKFRDTLENDSQRGGQLQRIPRRGLQNGNSLFDGTTISFGVRIRLVGEDHWGGVIRHVGLSLNAGHYQQTRKCLIANINKRTEKPKRMKQLQHHVN
jgi:hypothetical protein